MGIARSLTSLTSAKRGLRLLYLSQTAYYQHKFRRCVRERYVYHGYGPYGIKVSAEIWPSVHRDTPLSSPSVYMSAANDLYASDGLSHDDLSDGWDNPRTALWPQAVKLLQVNLLWRIEECADIRIFSSQLLPARISIFDQNQEAEIFKFRWCRQSEVMNQLNLTSK